MTNQELFDKVAHHLRTQDGFARGPYGVCLYRAPNGKKCAAGVLILDEHYHSGLEDGSAADAAHVRVALIKSGVAPDQIPLVRSLQFHAHDGPAYGSKTVEEGLAWIAQTYDLVYTPPQGDVA